MQNFTAEYRLNYSTYSFTTSCIIHPAMQKTASTDSPMNELCTGDFQVVTEYKLHELDSSKP